MKDLNELCLSKIKLLGCNDYSTLLVMNQKLTHWRWDKSIAISQTTFSNAFSCMKIYEYPSIGLDDDVAPTIIWTNDG